jgi:hypothetical protein
MRVVQINNTTLLIPDDLIEWIVLRIGWLLLVFKGHRVMTNEWCAMIDEYTQIFYMPTPKK